MNGKDDRAPPRVNERVGEPGVKGICSTPSLKRPRKRLLLVLGTTSKRLRPVASEGDARSDRPGSWRPASLAYSMVPSSPRRRAPTDRSSRAASSSVSRRSSVSSGTTVGAASTCGPSDGGDGISSTTATADVRARRSATICMSSSTSAVPNSVSRRSVRARQSSTSLRSASMWSAASCASRSPRSRRASFSL
jgi:hypothetical protein